MIASTIGGPLAGSARSPLTALSAGALSRDAELAQLPASTGAGAPVSGSPPEAVFGKAITSRIESAPGGERADPVDPVGDAAVRRGAVAERLEQEAEARLGLLGVDAEQRRGRAPGRPASLIRIEPPPISQPFQTRS